MPFLSDVLRLYTNKFSMQKTLKYNEGLMSPTCPLSSSPQGRGGSRTHWAGLSVGRGDVTDPAAPHGGCVPGPPGPSRALQGQPQAGAATCTGHSGSSQNAALALLKRHQQPPKESHIPKDKNSVSRRHSSFPSHAMSRGPYPPSAFLPSSCFPTNLWKPHTQDPNTLSVDCVINISCVECFKLCFWNSSPKR